MLIQYNGKIISIKNKDNFIKTSFKLQLNQLEFFDLRLPIQDLRLQANNLVNLLDYHFL